MPVCDGSECSKNIPWRITTRSLQLSNRNVAFNTEVIVGNLRKVLEEHGVRVDRVGNSTPILKSLCNDCWKRQAAAWGDAATYAPARARTTAQGCFFQVPSAAFYDNQAPSPERILSCVVHELMHFWSFNSVGVQDFNRTVNVDWDEAIADTLGFQTYKKTYASDNSISTYYTPYDEYPKGLEKIKNQVSALPKFKLNNWLNGNENLPLTDLRVFIDGLPDAYSDAVKKSHIAMEVPTLVLRALFTWFFAGPQTEIMGTTCRGFLSETGVKKLMNTSTAFPGYGGPNGDAAHRI